MSFAIIDPATIDDSAVDYRGVGALVYTHDGRLLLQQRDGGAPSFPWHLGTFGGGLEAGEDAATALMRELEEELGARVDVADLIPLPTYTGSAEGSGRGNEVQYFYVWHDTHGTITGCYEGLPAYFASVAEALTHEKIMPCLKVVLEDYVTTRGTNGFLG